MPYNSTVNQSNERFPSEVSLSIRPPPQPWSSCSPVPRAPQSPALGSPSEGQLLGGEGCQSDPSAFPAFSSSRACKGTDCGDAELVGKLLLPLIFYVYIVLSLIWVSEFGNRTCWPMRLRRFPLRNILDGQPTMGMIPRIPTIIPVASVTSQ